MSVPGHALDVVEDPELHHLVPPTLVMSVCLTLRAGRVARPHQRRASGEGSVAAPRPEAASAGGHHECAAVAQIDHSGRLGDGGEHDPHAFTDGRGDAGVALVLGSEGRRQTEHRPTPLASGRPRTRPGGSRSPGRRRASQIDGMASVCSTRRSGSATAAAKAAATAAEVSATIVPATVRHCSHGEAPSTMTVRVRPHSTHRGIGFHRKRRSCICFRRSLRLMLMHRLDS